MSIAGDTQPRVPGFNSYSETVLSPRRSGIAWSTAALPGNATLPTASGTGAIAIGSGSAFSGSINIGSNTSNATSSSSVCLGNGNTLSGGSSGTQHIVIGTNSNASAGSSNVGHTMAIGFNCSATGRNQIAIGSLAANGGGEFGSIYLTNSAFVAAGDIGTGFIVQYTTTSNATPSELFSGRGTASTAPDQNFVSNSFSTYIFDIDIVARSVGSAGAACWNLKFGANRNNATGTSTSGGLSKSIIYTVGTTTGWDVTASMTSDGNSRLAIVVTGAASTTIRWVANVRFTKVVTAS